MKTFRNKKKEVLLNVDELDPKNDIFFAALGATGLILALVFFFILAIVLKFYWLLFVPFAFVVFIMIYLSMLSDEEKKEK